MPRADGSSHGKEKIGTVRMNGVDYDVCYIGGSTFIVNLSNDPTASPPRFDLSVLKDLVKARQLKITSPSRFEEICAGIGPDGSTKTHNADGTLKSVRAQTLDDLTAEGHVVRGEGERRPTGSGSRQRQPQTSSLHPSRSGSLEPPREERQQSGREDPFSAGTTEDVPAERRRPQRRPAAVVDTDPFASAPSQPDPFAEIPPQSDPFSQSADGIDESLDENPFPDEAGSRSERQGSRRGRGERPERHNRMVKQEEPQYDPRDLNRDGKVDELDTFVEKGTHTSMLLMFVLALTAAAAIGLFFGAYFLTSSFLGKDGQVQLPEISIPFLSGNQNKANDNKQPENTGASQNPQQNTESTEPDVPPAERTGFDPETAVVNMPMADTVKQETAIKVFQAIRTAILSGDVNGFLAAVDLERMAGEIAPAYADAATAAQRLSEAEKIDTLNEYHARFVVNEKQHVVDRDVYASIFGGRIREVRQDPNDINCTYVVMESISGDHQRICFALRESPEGWTVTDIMDPVGYISMIAK